MAKNLSKLLRKDTVHKPRDGRTSPRVPKVPRGSLKLHELGSRGKIRASFSKTNNLSEISMIIVNGSSRDINIELTGGVLHPDNDGFQRLFVAGVRDDPSPSVNVPAGGEAEVALSTCCMDQRKTPPNGTVGYTPSAEPPPANNVTAARNWLDARQALSNIEAGLDPAETKTFCLQTEFTGKKHKNDENEIRRKADLGYVQEVCWGKRNP